MYTNVYAILERKPLGNPRLYLLQSANSNSQTKEYFIETLLKELLSYFDIWRLNKRYEDFLLDIYPFIIRLNAQKE